MARNLWAKSMDNASFIKGLKSGLFLIITSSLDSYSVCVH